MNQRPSQLTRFRVMAAMALAVLAIYLVVLFNTQVVHHEEYLAKSIQAITRMENVAIFPAWGSFSDGRGGAGSGCIRKDRWAVNDWGNWSLSSRSSMTRRNCIRFLNSAPDGRYGW